MTTFCQCEANRQHHKHVGPCRDASTTTIRTIYGTFEMCEECAAEFPSAFLLAADLRFTPETITALEEIAALKAEEVSRG